MSKHPPRWNRLETILHTNKGFTAQLINHQLGRRGSVWQDERYDRIIRDDDEFWEKWNYITENPQRQGLVQEPLNYKWLYQDTSAFQKSASLPPK
jgi:putative transposase